MADTKHIPITDATHTCDRCGKARELKVVRYGGEFLFCEECYKRMQFIGSVFVDPEAEWDGIPTGSSFSRRF